MVPRVHNAGRDIMPHTALEGRLPAAWMMCRLQHQLTRQLCQKMKNIMKVAPLVVRLRWVCHYWIGLRQHAC